MLTRWDPFAEIARLQSNLDRAWGQPSGRAGFAPAVDIFEEDGAIVLTAEVPGLKAEEIDVHVENQILTLSGQRSLENEEQREGYHRIERSYGSFTRSFALPKNVDAEHIEAELDAGILRLRIPKQEQPERRRIAVRHAGGEATEAPANGASATTVDVTSSTHA